MNVLPTPRPSKPPSPLMHSKAQPAKPVVSDDFVSEAQNPIGLLHKLPYENSIATICFEGTTWQKIDVAAKAGFDSIEIMSEDLNQGSAEEIIAYCKAKNIKVSILQPFRDLEGYEPAKFEERLAEFEEFLKTSQVLETDVILLCANCDSQAKDDLDLVVPQLKRASEVARKYGVKIAYENLSWATHNYRLEKLVDVILAVDEENFGMCFDMFHINIHQSSMECMRKLDNKVFFVQYCDSPALNKEIDILTHARNYRLFPLQGDYANVLASMELLIQLHYKGPISLEVFNKSYKDTPNSCTCVAQDALRSLVYLQALHSDVYKGTQLLPNVKVAGIEQVGPNTWQGIDVVFASESDRQDFVVRASQLGYPGLFHSLQVKTGHTSQQAVIKVPSRLMFNRYTLVIKALLGFKTVEGHKLNVYNNFHLPEQVVFGNDQGVTLVLGIEN